MNNDLKDLKKKNKSLNVLLNEYESLVDQKDTNIAQQMVMLENNRIVIHLLKHDKSQLQRSIEKETKKTKLFRSTTIGAVIFIPVAFVVGSLAANRYR